MAREEDEKGFQELLDKQKDHSNFFALFIKKQIEAINVKKASKELCENFKIDEKDKAKDEEDKEDKERSNKKGGHQHRRRYRDYDSEEEWKLQLKDYLQIYT